jgi:hypothetical protein
MKPKDLAALLAVTIPARAPVLITGAPGVGKSDIIAQAAIASGAELIIEHPVVSDPTDFKGLPFATNGIADFLPFGSLRRIIEAKKLTLFFLDDLGQSPPAVQAACMQLLLARRVNGHVVSDYVAFAAATNRRQDRAGVMGLLEPVKSRFATIIELVPDREDWVRWALAAGMPTELIAFIRFREKFLFDFKPTADLVNSPCPRTVANVGKLMKMGIPRGLEFEVFKGAAGEGFAAEFMGFLRIYRNLPNPDLVLMQPDTAEVPTDPAVLYALCGALSARASDQTADRLFRYYNRLPPEFSVMAARDTFHAHPDVAQTRSAIEWHSKHADVQI